MTEKVVPSEVLVINQGFEYRVQDFTLDDFRGNILSSFPTKEENRRYLGFYRIEKYDPGSHCPWGHSRWITGDNGKLELLDQYWDSSG